MYWRMFCATDFSSGKTFGVLSGRDFNSSCEGLAPVSRPRVWAWSLLLAEASFSLKQKTAPGGAVSGASVWGLNALTRHRQAQEQHNNYKQPAGERGIAAVGSGYGHA